MNRVMIDVFPTAWSPKKTCVFVFFVARRKGEVFRVCFLEQGGKRSRSRGRTRCAVFFFDVGGADSFLQSFFPQSLLCAPLPCSLFEREESFTLEAPSDTNSHAPACTWRGPPSLSSFPLVVNFLMLFDRCLCRRSIFKASASSEVLSLLSLALASAPIPTRGGRGREATAAQGAEKTSCEKRSGCFF